MFRGVNEASFKCLLKLFALEGAHPCNRRWAICRSDRPTKKTNLIAIVSSQMKGGATLHIEHVHTGMVFQKSLDHLFVALVASHEEWGPTLDRLLVQCSLRLHLGHA